MSAYRPVACGLWRGALAGAAAHPVWTDRDDPALLAPASADALHRFRRSIGGPSGPSCSLWAQLAFNALLVPAACLLAEPLPSRPRPVSLGIATCPRMGRPLRLMLGQGARDSPHADDLPRLIEAELSRLIEAAHVAGGVSRRMLGESAGLAWAWAAREIAALDPPAARRLASRTPWPGRLDSRPPGRRRFCCLRRLLPGWQACPGTCPLEP